MFSIRFSKFLQITKKSPIKLFQNSNSTNNKEIKKFCSTNQPNIGDDNSLNKNFTAFTAKKLIKLSGLEFEDSFTSIKTTCPVCSVSTDSKTTKSEPIFINKTTGDFICPSCQYSGKWCNIDKFFNNKKPSPGLEKSRQLFIESKPRITPLVLDKSMKPIKKLDETAVMKIFDKFSIKNIPTNVFQNLPAYYDESAAKLLFPMISTIENQIVGYKYLQVKYCDVDHQNKIEEKTFPETSSHGAIIVRPLKSTKESQTAILVLNILDLLALSSQKLNNTIICLPHDYKSLPQECLPLLERYQKLILWFNYDAASWDTAKNFSKKLDEKRCLIVRPIDYHHSTPYQALLENLDIKEILTKSQPILHKAITTFSSLRQDVLSDLQNIDKVQGVKWKRYPSLNKYLKGHRKGELSILTGPTGCGKTTFMSEYSLDLAMQGVNTLWGSFEIRNTRLASTLLRQMAGHPLDEHINEFDYWADEFEKLPIYFMTFHGQQSIKIVMDAIDHAQYVHDVHHVIIDNVQFMMGISDEQKHMDRFWKQDAIIAAFRTFATKKNCHVTLVIHPRKERDAEDLTTSSIFGSAKAAQEADNVLIIQDKRLTSIRGKKYLQVAKNRYSGDLGIMPMDFDKAALSYAPKKKKQDEKEKTEN